MDKWLSYDQISLIPTQVSTLEHRAEADTSVQFGPTKLRVPIIAAPMPDVSNGDMAAKLYDLGSFGWMHRFQSPTQQLDHIQQNFGAKDGAMYGVGVGLDDGDRVKFLYACGARIFCVDTANGASVRVQKTLGDLKDKYPDIFIVAGNVASVENFQKLEDWGADAIRVGIAGGSVCETRTETGVYSPMASAIQNITYAYWPYWEDRHKIDRKRKALLVADGGIRTPADMCKAIALGADLVMAGGVFAGTDESPGPIIKKRNGKKVKLLRGAASYSVQNGKSEYNEGAEDLVAYQGSVEKVIKRFAAGLRSSMSYMNAHNLDEYRRNVKIVEVG